MTCIIGLEQDGKVYIGADSGCASGWTVRQTRLPKVFWRDPFLIGYTTSFRMGQILQHHLTVEPQDGEDDDMYMVCKFAEAVRKCLKEGGFAKVEHNVNEGGIFLVGYKGRLYRVSTDFQVNSMADGYDACGCGEDFALGAMYVLGELAPKVRIRRALEATACFCGAIRRPFVIRQMGG